MPHVVDGYTSPNDGVSIEIDPKNNGSWVRKAFLIESFLNFTAIPLITHPRTVLPYLLNNPADVNPSSVLFSRSLGCLVMALTAALWTGVPNTKTAIESRRAIYYTLGVGEIALIPILALEAMKGGGRDAAFSVRGSVFAIANLVPILVWRIYVLFIKPEMIGRYKEVKRE